MYWEVNGTMLVSRIDPDNAWWASFNAIEKYRAFGKSPKTIN
jgi:hypothetical protein